MVTFILKYIFIIRIQNSVSGNYSDQDKISRSYKYFFLGSNRTHMLKVVIVDVSYL